MSTPHAPAAESSVPTDLDPLEQLDSDEIEKIETLLSTGTSPAVLQEQLVDAFLR